MAVVMVVVVVAFAVVLVLALVVLDGVSCHWWCWWRW